MNNVVKENLTEKNIKDFSTSDTIYIKKPNGGGRGMSRIYLCSFISFERGRVTGKVIGETSHYEFPTEESLTISAPLSDCAVYGNGDVDHPTYHWFNPSGHAYHAVVEVESVEPPSEHESYGVIEIRKQHGGSASACFGSPILNRSIISLTVSKAKLARGLHQDSYYPKEQILRVEMTMPQFTEMLLSANSGSTPVTIKRVGAKAMEECPFVSKIEQFEAELKNKIQKTRQETQEEINDFASIIENSKLSKKEKDFMIRSLAKIQRETEANLPFLFSQMAEEMERLVVNAKEEVREYCKAKATEAGLPSVNTPNLLTE